MARRPELDEPFQCHIGAATRGTRVFVRELAKYLHHNPGAVRRYANRHGFLYWVRQGPNRPPLPYVTEAGAMRIIAYFRALQGGMYLKGYKFHENRQRIAEYAARKAAACRARASLLAHMGAMAPTNGGSTPHDPLAIPPAGTEDEAQQD
jgi:hypothetical protein